MGFILYKYVSAVDRSESADSFSTALKKGLVLSPVSAKSSGQKDFLSDFSVS